MRQETRETLDELKRGLRAASDDSEAAIEDALAKAELFIRNLPEDERDLVYGEWRDLVSELLKKAWGETELHESLADARHKAKGEER